MRGSTKVVPWAKREDRRSFRGLSRPARECSPDKHLALRAAAFDKSEFSSNVAPTTRHE